MGSFHDSKYDTNEKFEYKNINIDFEALKIEAKKYELPSTNNNFGINNDFYSRVIAPNINKDFFPFSIEMPKTLEENEEFSHFLILLETLKNYKMNNLLTFSRYYIVEEEWPAELRETGASNFWNYEK